MSLLKMIRAQLGLSSTPANNFTLDASADNGTMKLARGNAGATTQDLITVNAANLITGGSGATLVGNGPIVSVSRITSNQSVSSGVWTKVLFNSVDVDTNNCFDAVNNRYTPKVAGYYQVNLNVYAGVGSGNITQAGAQIQKNGELYAATYAMSASFGTEDVLAVSTLVYLNGTTDYIEGHAVIGATNPHLKFGITRMTAVLVRAA